jgi:hypothetical protein
MGMIYTHYWQRSLNVPGFWILNSRNIQVISATQPQFQLDEFPGIIGTGELSLDMIHEINESIEDDIERNSAI